MPRKIYSDTEPISPGCLYPLSAFRRASGLSETRIREARRSGLKLPKMQVGRRAFVRGADGIAYIEALAAMGTADAN